MGKQPDNTSIKFWRDPDLPGVEVRYSSYNEEAFRKHSHTTYSIGLIENGRASFFMEDVMYTAEAGQIALIGPEVVHVCSPDLDSGWTYRMFYVDPSWLKTVAEELFRRKTVAPVFPSPVVDDKELYEVWLKLHQAIIDKDGRLEKETLLVQGLVDLISRHGELGEAQEPQEAAGAVELVKNYLAAHLSDKISLDTLSQIAHLSRYHLLRVFQNEVGLPPHAYQNQLRVKLGKRLLAEGMSISQAASEAGFVDQSHFSRVFKQYTGATPRQYQADHSVRS